MSILKTMRCFAHLANFPSRLPVPIPLECGKIIGPCIAPYSRKKGYEELPVIDDVIERLSEKLIIHHGSLETAPAEAIKNEESMQELLKLIDCVSPPMTEYPARVSKTLEFFLADSERIAESKKAVLELKTSGGNCKNLVEQSIQNFLKQCDFPTQFRWQDESWLLKERVPIKTREISPEDLNSSAKSQIENSGSETREQEMNLSQPESELEVPSEEASETSPRNSKFTTTQISEILEKFDKALEAIASVPWHTDILDQRRIQEQLVCVLEGDGWRLQEPCLHLWAGERDLTKVCKGLDDASQKMVERIYHYVLNFEQQHGKRTAELSMVSLFSKK